MADSICNVLKFGEQANGSETFIVISIGDGVAERLQPLLAGQKSIAFGQLS